MHIKQIELVNFRCFEHLKLRCHRQLNVFVGVNASGKTALLLGLRRCLGTFVGQFSDIDTAEKQSIMHIAPEDVRFSNGAFASKTSFKCIVEIEGKEYEWNRTKEGRNGKTDSKGTKVVDSWVKNIEREIGHPTKTFDVLLPLVAYFSTDRGSRERRTSKSDRLFSSRMRGYFNALGQSTNVEYLKVWFKDRQLEKYQSNRKSTALDLMLKVIKRIPGVLNIEYIVQSSDSELESDLYLTIKKGDLEEKIGFEYLSDGQKMLVCILADIAMRCLLLNPQLNDKANETAGVVLIDEVDLHLHPSWQRLAVPALLEAFPCMQFFFTTHSPQVLSEVPKESVFILKNGNIAPPVNLFTEGRDSNSILYDIFGVEKRPQEEQNDLDRFYRLLDEKNEKEAWGILTKLEAKWGAYDTDIVRANLHYQDLLNEVHS